MGQKIWLSLAEMGGREQEFIQEEIVEKAHELT